MVWIRTVSEEEAEGKVREIYGKWAQSTRRQGKTSPIRKVQSMAPDIMEAWLNLDHTIMYRQGGISRVQREMIAVTTSALNGCSF